MKTSIKAAIAATGILISAGQAFSAARLTYLLKQRPQPLTWSSESFPVHYVLDRDAAARFEGGAATVQKAMESWGGVTGSAAKFEADQIASISAGKDGKNSISLKDKLYEGSGFLAFTTTFYDDNARIFESDIQVDPSVAAGGNVNLQKLIAHEAGHMLGLDHSAVVASIMYPFVGNDSYAGLDSDDRIATAAIYPKSGRGGATLRGAVRGPTGAIFAAQVVALNESGAAIASALTDATGSFELNQVPAGRYRLYAEPLDGPVDPQNFSGVWRDARKAEFRTEFLRNGEVIEVRDGSVTERLELTNDGLPATLNPRWVGAFPAFSTQVKLGSSAAVVRAGESVSIALGGDGVVGGLTEFEIPNPGFKRVSEFKYGSNYLWATFQVSATVAPGSFVLVAKNGNETAALTGAIRIEGSSEPGSSGRRRAAR
ncbi:MAG TPA: matrixin family metalloprotease [Thermoanaerobaculia bacterium]|nr:matrixin family metalloprotease [Thermoanaerobaculia bacterium]